MLTARNLATLASLAALVVLLAGTSASARDCFGGLRQALKEGGYSPGVSCKGISQKIEYIGKTHSRHGRSYLVYSLTYRTTAPGVASHYGQRILIFDSHRKYLGHYRIEYKYRPRIIGSDVVLVDMPADQGNRIHLGRAKPPDPEWLDGDQAGFQ